MPGSGVRPEFAAVRALTLVRVAWASPCSLLGLLIGLPLLLAGGSARRIGRTLEVALHEGHCPPDSRLQRLPFSAITFGHVILGASRVELDRHRSHEAVHVRQYERLGPFLLVAYPLSSLVALVQGRCPYRDNRFEVEARNRSAAHQDGPPAPRP